MDYKERRVRDIFLAVAKSSSLILMWLLAAADNFQYELHEILYQIKDQLAGNDDNFISDNKLLSLLANRIEDIINHNHAWGPLYGQRAQQLAGK